MLRATLAETGLVLVGFGAEPEYVLNSLAWALEVAAEPPHAVVSDKNREAFVKQSPRLSAMCQVADAEERYVQEDGAELFGEVLRSIYQGRARAVLLRATERAKTVGADRLAISEEALGALRASILERPLIDLLEFLWRGNAVSEDNPGQAGLPTLAAQENALVNVLAALLLLGSADDVTGLAPKGPGFLIQTEGLSVDLWPVIPASEANASQAVAAVGENAAAFSTIADVALPLVVVIGGTWGIVPRGGPTSLIDSPPAENVAVGQRYPTDAVTLEALQERIDGLGKDGGASIHALIRLQEAEE
jgi:hypothetical protein